MTDEYNYHISDFDCYIRQGEGSKRERALNWQTAIGLQAVDGLTPSAYLIDTAKRHIEGEIDIDQTIEHITKFISGLWQIHAFGEGNTRTTAVFSIQYLRSIGFNVDNTLFVDNSWYFRNALVRANYKNAKLGINYDNSFLIAFFCNLLLGECNELKNRYLRIGIEQAPNKHRTSTEQAPDKLIPNNENISLLIRAIGDGNYSVKEMMEALNFKHRPTFIYNYLQPSIEKGWVDMLYPNKPNHPRQRYRLTVKALTYKAESR